MARYNEILVGRHNRGIQKVLSMKGGPPAPQLSTEIQPQFDIHKLRRDHIFTFGERLWAMTALQAAPGANVNAWRVRNPANSGVLGTIEKILLNAAGLSTPLVNMGGTVADLATIFSSKPLDFRQGISGGSTIVASFGQPATTTGNSIISYSSLPASTIADVIIDENQQIVLAPGDQLTLYNATSNSFSAAIWWRERPIEEGEVQ